eukprot:519766_1
MLSLFLFVSILWIHTARGLQTMDCTGFQSCDSGIVTCPENDDCEILCGPFGCWSAKITCPSNYECTMVCYDGESCMSVDVNALQSTKLKFKGCTQSDACHGMTVRCPQNDNGIKKCIMTGNGQFGGDILFQMTFYAVNSWNDIDLTNVSTTDIYGTMYCSDDFSESCDFEDSWSCHCDYAQVGDEVVGIIIVAIILTIVGGLLILCIIFGVRKYKKSKLAANQHEINLNVNQQIVYQQPPEHDEVANNKSIINEKDHQSDGTNWFLNEVGSSVSDFIGKLVPSSKSSKENIGNETNINT